MSHVAQLFMGSGLELNSYSSKTCANVLSLSVLLVTLSNNVSFFENSPLTQDRVEVGLRCVGFLALRSLPSDDGTQHSKVVI